MPYVDGFVVPVPKKNIAAYRKMARMGARMWKKHGALEYFEAVGDDLDVPFGMPFPKAFTVKPGETVVFSWILYKSRAHRDAVNKKVMQGMGDMDPKTMPFDFKRMVYGGFKVIVEG